MAEMYDQIATAIYEEEDPHAAAKLVLQILWEKAEDLPVADVAPDHWRAVFDAYVRQAEASDLAKNEAEARVRLEEWPAFKTEAEGLGCSVTLLKTSDGLWEIDGPGVYVELNLKSGAVTGFCEADYLGSLEPLARSIRSDVARKAKDKADEARKRQLRLTHQWDNNRKAWIPRGGSGAAA